MLKKFLTIISFAVLFLSPRKVFSQQQEKINNYQVNIQIQGNGKISVEEEIQYDFGNSERHGIFREIPLIKENEEGERFKLKFTDISVENPSGETYQYKETRNRENLKLQVGDPNEKITGEHTYVISYTVSGALTYFEGFDELYWDAVGSNWNVPIGKVKVTIQLPQSVPQEKLNFNCFIGEEGSGVGDRCETSKEENKIIYESTRPLKQREGITVVLNFDSGYVEKLFPEKVRPEFLQYILIGLAITLLTTLNLILPVKKVIQLVKQRRKLKRESKIVAAWFQPPKSKNGKEFSPSETRAILTGSANERSITSEIIFLAQKGYLKIISEGKKDFRFRKLKSEDESLTNFQQTILEALFHDYKKMELKGGLRVAIRIFGKSKEIIGNKERLEENARNALSEEKQEITLKQLKKSKYFGTRYNDIIEEILGNLDEEGIYKKDLNKIKNRNTLIAVLSGFFFGFVNLIVYSIAAKIEKPRTEFGIDAYSKAKSLKNFLESQEGQLEFQADEQMFFEKLLPYATAFGVEDVWMKRFSGLGIKPPDWYEGDFNAARMAVIGSAVSSGIKGSTATANRSSSGFSSGSSGGSVGGGGGGGGGGSW